MRSENGQRDDDLERALFSLNGLYLGNVKRIYPSSALSAHRRLRLDKSRYDGIAIKISNNFRATLDPRKHHC